MSTPTDSYGQLLERYAQLFSRGLEAVEDLLHDVSNMADSPNRIVLGSEKIRVLSDQLTTLQLLYSALIAHVRYLALMRQHDLEAEKLDANHLGAE